MIVLELLQGSSARSLYELRAGVVTLGRAATNTVVITDYHLSGEHGQIVREGDGYVYRDLRSTNGSVVDRGGQRLAVDATRRFELGLAHGDLLLLGDPKNPVSIRVRILPGAGAAARDGGDELGERLIASRSIVDLPAVTDQLEHDPVGALRVYKALQKLGGRLDQSACVEACVEAMFELLPRATHVAVLLRAESDKDRFVLAMSTRVTRGGSGSSRGGAESASSSAASSARASPMRPGQPSARSSASVSAAPPAAVCS